MSGSTLAQARKPQSGQLPAAPEKHSQKQPVQPGWSLGWLADHREANRRSRFSMAALPAGPSPQGRCVTFLDED
jgi:hypothetical protein